MVLHKGQLVEFYSQGCWFKAIVVNQTPFHTEVKLINYDERLWKAKIEDLRICEINSDPGDEAAPEPQSVNEKVTDTKYNSRRKLLLETSLSLHFQRHFRRSKN